ncbi:MAG: hypothetical protein LBS68_03510 [Puniceicoccales bacterium]|jgi:hypothetical protein|nr:hypothetical protein [Puniceicoccales bacterium]
MNLPTSPGKKTKISLVPLEEELRESWKRRQVLDRLNGILAELPAILSHDIEPGQYEARDSFRRAVTIALGIVKNFRG